jgi:hypothetical protein
MELPKLSLSALVGLVIGALLIAFVEPETTAGAAVLGAIGLIPCLIFGHLLPPRRTPNRTDDSAGE